MDNKSKEMQNILNFLSEEMAKSKGSGMSRSSALKKNKCSKCGGEANKFRDKLSEKEYTLTAWCQSCQDYVFGV